MRHKKWWLFGIGALTGVALAQGQTVTFISTQFAQLEEAQKIRTQVLADAPLKVDFIPQDAAALLNRLQAEARSGRSNVHLVGGLHGELASVEENLDNVDDVMTRLRGRNFPNNIVALGKYGGKNQKYVPWAQATYIMVANKKALPHLPQGADINNLTYRQLAQWGRNIEEATGQKRLGFPAGPNGLIHRFVQGYLLPSYASTVVRRFKSPLAEQAWTDMQAIWQHTNPQSTSYNFMQEPLASGEVWVAWDHVARLRDAVTAKPEDYVAFPAPRGPRGRGYMPVVSGLAIPKGTTNRAGAVAAIEYLTQPKVQAEVLRQTGFFPVTGGGDLPANLPAGIRLMADAVEKTTGVGSVVSLLPIGLGAQNGEFNKVYVDTFQRIVVRRQNIKEALSTQATELQRVMSASKAPCWAPDTSSSGSPCPVE